MKRRLMVWVFALSVVAVGASSEKATDLAQIFQERCAQLAADAFEGRHFQVPARDDWILHRQEVAFAGTGVFWGDRAAVTHPRLKPDVANSVPAIVDFSNQLKKRGITLIFMPVPARPVIFPEAILEEARGLDPMPYLKKEHDGFYAELKKGGVEVLDLNRLFLANRSGEHGAPFCRSDEHWTPAGIRLAARAVAEKIRAASWVKDFSRVDMTEHWETKDHFGGSFKVMKDRYGRTDLKPERVPVRNVRLGSGEPVSLTQRQSPVVIIGDSNAIWWHRDGSALPQQLGFELGFPVDLLSTKGGGATATRMNLIRTAASNPDYLESKRVVVWCFTSRSLTESREGWIMTPLPPPKQP